MCEYFSCIITKDLKVHWSKKTTSECTQPLKRSELGHCLGRALGWDQEDCFTHNDLTNQEALKTNKKIPRDWLGPQKLKEYGFNENL